MTSPVSNFILDSGGEVWILLSAPMRGAELILSSPHIIKNTIQMNVAGRRPIAGLWKSIMPEETSDKVKPECVNDVVKQSYQDIMMERYVRLASIKQN